MFVCGGSSAVKHWLFVCGESSAVKHWLFVCGGSSVVRHWLFACCGSSAVKPDHLTGIFWFAYFFNQVLNIPKDWIFISLGIVE